MQAQAQGFEDKMVFEQMVPQMRANADKVRAEERQSMEARIREAGAARPKNGRGKQLLLSLVLTIGKVALAALGFPLLGGSPFGGLI